MNSLLELKTPKYSRQNETNEWMGGGWTNTYREHCGATKMIESDGTITVFTTTKLAYNRDIVSISDLERSLAIERSLTMFPS